MVFGLATITAQTIVTPPTNLLVTAGQSATFSVEATGAQPLTYQWRRNGFPIPGATSSSFTLTNTSRTDADYYDVVVSAGLASVTSPTVRLSVAPTSYVTSVAPDPKWDLQLEQPGAEYPTAVVPLSDGRVYIAGGFVKISGIRRTCIARVNPDGITLDPTFTPAEIDNSVSALAVQNDGKIVIAGDFLRINGFLRNHLARLNTDGSLDITFAPATEIETRVSALALQNDGRILIGGNFNSYAGTARNSLVRLNENGSLDTSFLTLGVSSLVYALLVQGDGRIWVGGSFNSYLDINGLPSGSRNLVRLNGNGTLDTTFNTASNPMASHSTVYALALQSDSKLVVGGSFTAIGTKPVGNIARYNSDGSLDTAFTSGGSAGFNNWVYSLATQASGGILVGGTFTSYAGAPTKCLARLNPDGSRDATFLTLGMDSTVSGLAIQPDGKLLLAGGFNGYLNPSSPSTTRSRFARLNADGTLAPGFSFSFSTWGTISKPVLLPGGKMLVNPRFSFMQGKTSGIGLCRLNPDATVDLTFNPGGVGANAAVVSAIAQPDGKVVISGAFTTYNGATANRIARLNTDGTLDPSFHPGAGLDSGGVTLAILPRGRVLVGGSFTKVNGIARNGLAVLLPDGTIDSTFAAGTGPSLDLSIALVQPDGKIVIGGNFTSFNGVPARHIARLNADGTLDSTFITGTGCDTVVCTLALQCDGKLIIGGFFSGYNGAARSGVARLNPDGTLDLGFEPPVIGSVLSLVAQEDGRVILRGDFPSVDGVATSAYLTRLNSNGTRDTTFRGNGFVGTSTLYCTMVMRDDGQLAMQSGGVSGFTVTQNASIPSIISAPSDQSITVGSTAIFTVTANSVLPLTYQWLFNGVPVAGATQASLSLPNVQVEQAGSYRVVVTNELGTTTSPAAMLILPKVPALVALDHLAQTYDGTPRPIIVTTVPAGLPVVLTYDGSATAPTGAGSYAVAATVADPSYEGSAVGTLTIAKAATTVTVGAQTVVYDGTPKSATATTSLSVLYLAFTYNGSAVFPTNAGSYTVNVAIDDPNYTGTGSGTLTITPAPAAVALSSLTATYDGAPKSVTALTSPSGLMVALTYNGSTTAPTKAGSYSVAASILDSNYAGSASGTFTIAKATATVTLEGLSAIYDGAPLPVTVNTTPAGLVSHVTYNGSVTPPIYPGSYAVAATVDDANYSGSASGTLFVTAGAMVRHAPILNGGLDGSLQMLLPEDVLLDGASWISGDLLVPGEPTVSESGSPIYVGLREASGSSEPTAHQITLNDGATLRYLVRRVDPIAMPTVSAPPAPTGTRNLVIASANPNVGNVSLLRNITLIGAGQLALPGGTFGVFSARGTSKLTLGTAGATLPTVYNLQGLALTEHSQLILLGPVVINLASAPSIQVSAGAEVYPDWLTLKIASGDMALNGDLVFSGFIVAPTSAVTIAGGATVYGGLASDQLTLDDGYLVFPIE